MLIGVQIEGDRKKQLTVSLNFIGFFFHQSSTFREEMYELK